MQRRNIQIAPAPRKVPFGTRVAALFGGFDGQFGWLFIAFSSLFVGFFVLDSEVITTFEFVGKVGHAQGQVVDIRETNASENDSNVLAIRFRYQVAGKSYDGVSYGLRAPFDAGERVKVEYLVARPHRARITGMRVRRFGRLVAIVLLFPVAGGMLVLRRLQRGFKEMKLLRKGSLAYGKLLQKNPTNTEINDQTVYELVFEFVVPPAEQQHDYRRPVGMDQKFTVKHSTHETAALEDEAEEPLLYHPDDPSLAAMIDGLPGRTSVTSEGEFKARMWVRYLIAPLAFLLVLSLFASGHIQDFFG